MKKKFLIIISAIGCLCILLLAGICLPASSTLTNKSAVVKGPILIDQLQNKHFQLQLIYSNITSDEIEVFNATPTHFSLDSLPYTSFTEGFISSEKNTFLLTLINQYRAQHQLDPISYYYNYIETETYDLVSLSGGLDGLYIINRITGDVSTPYFVTSNAEEKQYIYHIAESDDQLYILSAKANSYEAFWYAINKSTFQVTATKSFVPPITAVKRNQYALDDEGTGYFVANNSLYVVSTKDTYSLPLSFTPDEVYYENGQLYAFSTSEFFLSYVVFDHNLQTTITGRVNLPNKEVSLVDSVLNGTTLYTITYDAGHPLYRNYLTIYNLESNEITYCLALKENEQLALLGIVNDTVS